MTDCAEDERNVSHRTVCPECEATETERISIDEPRGVNSGTVLVETRTCNVCYAGFRLKYVLEEVEVHHDPEVEV